MNTCLILQARSKSKRYPNKVFENFGNMTFIQYVQKRFLTFKNIDKFVLAVPLNEIELFQDYVEEGFELRGGSEYNVLERYYEIVDEFQPDLIIRATGDNPFVSSKLVEETINLYKKYKFDYYIEEGYPLGTHPEFISYEGFMTSYLESSKPYHFEHVTPYIYENPKYFDIVKKTTNYDMHQISHLRLTFDEKQDYQVLNNIASIFNYKINITLTDIMQKYKSNKRIFEQNLNIKQKEYKQVDENANSNYNRAR